MYTLVFSILLNIPFQKRNMCILLKEDSTVILRPLEEVENLSFDRVFSILNHKRLGAMPKSDYCL